MLTHPCIDRAVQVLPDRRQRHQRHAAPRSRQRARQRVHILRKRVQREGCMVAQAVGADGERALLRVQSHRMLSAQRPHGARVQGKLHVGRNCPNLGP